jgi:hypothetical protein
MFMGERCMVSPDKLSLHISPRTNKDLSVCSIAW